MSPPAILLGGGVIALSVARSLGRAGVQVIALGHDSDPVQWSRHCDEFVNTGAGKSSQGAWLDWLRTGPENGAVVLPCNDDALELTVASRAEIDALGYRQIEADDEALAATLDKERTYEIARANGVPAPTTVTVRAEADLQQALDAVGLPCAVKPLHSHRFAEHFGLTQKVFRVTSAGELEAALARMRAVQVDALVTEIIPGGDELFCSVYTYIDERGEPLFRFTKRKPRQHPIHFGLGSFHVTDWNPEVAEAGLSFLRAAGVRGLACVELKRDPRNDDLVLIECTHRFTGGTEVVHAAGVDLAQFTYNRLVGRPLPSMEPYRLGVRMCVPRADLRAMLAYRRVGELSFRSWAATLRRPIRFPVASGRDPGPLAGALHRKLRRLPRRLVPGGR